MKRKGAGQLGGTGATFRRVGDVPCGQCIECRLERSRQWAVRCIHEASLHHQSHFITLTFNDRNCPDSLDKRDWQLFAKRVRNRVSRFRFMMSGEYGELNFRPHYHAIMFGLELDDLEYLRKSPSGENLYTSRALEECWPYGFVSVGSVTFESAAYVARYVVKKITGPSADAHYQGRVPEFSLMSRRPGIGAGWFDKFKSDVFPSDEVVVRGKAAKPPRYYLERLPDVEKRAVKLARSVVQGDDVSLERLAVREKVVNSRLSHFQKRKL